MTYVRDRIKEAPGGMQTREELEGKLESAKDHYRDQQAEIERLKAEIEKLKGGANR